MTENLQTNGKCISSQKVMEKCKMNLFAAIYIVRLVLDCTSYNFRAMQNFKSFSTKYNFKGVKVFLYFM